MSGGPDRLAAAGRPTRFTTLARSDAVAAAALLAATVIALVWANLPGGTYEVVWSSPVAMDVGGHRFGLDAQHWVNDALMTFFFLLISLEVKRDVVLGELADRRRVRLPLVAALAGLALPAAIFLAVTTLSGQDPAARGAWGVVISTDTAFVLGLLAVLGPRVPVNLRAFVLALSVVDDVGALAVIAVAYTSDLRVVPLLLALAGLAVVWVLSRRHVWRGAAYAVVGAGVWCGVLASGVHPTVAGVAVGLLLPVYAPHPLKVGAAEAATREYGRSPTVERAHRAVATIHRAVSVNDRGQRLLVPWVNLLVVPVFALANAGVRVDAATLADAIGSGLTWAVVAGLVLGKATGVTTATLTAVRAGLGRLPSGLSARHVATAGLMSGVGFTISLFIIDLALRDPALASQARIGVLVASATSAVLALGAAAVVHRVDVARSPGRQVLVRPVSAEHDHVDGRVGAPMELVVYASFVSAGPGRIAEVGQEVRESLGQDVVFVFRHLPGDDPVAETAAQACEEAAAQRRFWPLHDALSARAGRLDERAVRRCAVDAGMNLARLDDALASGVHAARVARDVRDAEAGGLDQPPRFFVNGQLHDGGLDADSLRAALVQSARPRDHGAGAGPPARTGTDGGTDGGTGPDALVGARR